MIGITWCGIPLADTRPEHHAHMRRWISSIQRTREVPPGEDLVQLLAMAAVLDHWLAARDQLGENASGERSAAESGTL